jgi:glycopeptide antibiotics resistance protein
LSPVGDQAANGAIATVVGILVALVLIGPTAAVQYRRDGRLGAGDLLTLVGAAVYGLALWTYTLLPFPVDDTFSCRRRQLEVFGSFRPVVDRGIVAPVTLLREAAFQQLALNVLLFVPLGFFVRLVVHRGLVVTTVLGLALSLAIETTQLSGVWGLYHCAYRVFDVDDLLVNTTGAFVGGVLAWLLLHRHRRVPETLPTEITLGRRWVGFATDAIFVAATGTAAAIAWRAWGHYVRDEPYRQVDRHTQVALQLLVPLVLEAALVLGAGRTVGEWAISVRAVAIRRTPTMLARVVKLALGVGGFTVLLMIRQPWSLPALGVLVLATLVASWRTRDHRGLTHSVSRMELEISH